MQNNGRDLNGSAERKRQANLFQVSGRGVRQRAHQLHLRPGGFGHGGQYQGPEGTAALAIVAPVWNIIYSLGLLTGIGGSVLLSAARGAGRQKEGDEYFTAALAGTVFFAAVSWLAIAFFDAPLLRLFGARDALLPLAQQYLLPVKFVVPLFLFNQMLAAFLRNDGEPGLATAAVLAGGVFNVFGDYFFVFTCDMGVFGAGLATAIGSGITFTVMLSHFFSRRCTLRPSASEMPEPSCGRF